MSAHNRKDISNQTINQWKILSHSHTKGKIAYYNCICLGCNKELIVDGRNIRSGRSKSCHQCSTDRSRLHSMGIRTPETDVRIKHTNENAKYAYLKRQLKASGRRRGYSFNLTINQIKELVTKKCHYCNSDPHQTVNILKNHALSQEKVEKYGEITYNGIDRIDSSKGYELDNVVTCCKKCNIAKHVQSTEEFKEHIRQLYENIDNF